MQNIQLGEPDTPRNDPLSLKYIKLVKTFLWTLGAWPGEILGQKVPFLVRYHRKHVPIQTSIVFIGQINYIVKFSRDMNLFVKGHCYLTTILSVLTTVRSSLPNFKRYGELTKTFLMSFHLIHFEPKGEYFQKIYTNIDKVSYYMTRFLITMMVCAIILFNAPPCYQNYKVGGYTGSNLENATLELSVYYTFPRFDPFDKFIFTSIFNVYLTYNCAISVCGLDLLLSLMVFQIIGHIQILRNNLSNFPKPKVQVTIRFNKSNGDQCVAIAEMYDAEENDVIHRKLKQCVDHHRLIVSFTDEVSEFFGPMLAFNYLFHLVSCCLLLLECSKGDTDAVLSFGPLTLIVFGQLIQISITFEVLGAMSEKLIDDVYGVPWECMDTKNRRLVCILLHRVQTPIRVVVMGLTSVGVTTMAGILKTTFTYFTFLQSIDE